MSQPLESMWVEDFGLSDYKTVWDWQKALVQSRLSGETTDSLLIGEHLPVLTVGRGTKPENLLTPEIPVLEIERGGDVTYHGPGQLVAYPIWFLSEQQRDLHQFLRILEQAVIDTMAAFDIEGLRNEGLTGVWVRSANDTGLKKVCSIGVAVKRWVTYHGLSLNVSCDLSAYQQINPCGLSSDIMANLSEFKDVSLEEVKRELVRQLAKAHQELVAQSQ